MSTKGRLFFVLYPWWSTRTWATTTQGRKEALVWVRHQRLERSNAEVEISSPTAAMMPIPVLRTCGKTQSYERRLQRTSIARIGRDE